MYLASLAALGAKTGVDSLKAQLAVACAEGIVMHNISGSTQTIQRWDGDNVSDATILVASDPISVSTEGGKFVTMPPYSSVVFALN